MLSHPPAAGVEPWEIVDEHGEAWVGLLACAFSMGVGTKGRYPFRYVKRLGRSGVVAFFFLEGKDRKSVV